MQYIHRKEDRQIWTSWPQTQPRTGNGSDRYHTEARQLHLSEPFSLGQEAATLWHKLSLHSGRRQDDIIHSHCKTRISIKKYYQAPPAIIFWGLLHDIFHHITILLLTFHENKIMNIKLSINGKLIWKTFSLFCPRELDLNCKNSICSTQRTVCYIDLSIFAISTFFLRLIQATCGFHPGKINTSLIWHDIINRHCKYLFSKRTGLEKSKCHFFSLVSSVGNFKILYNFPCHKCLVS